MAIASITAAYELLATDTCPVTLAARAGVAECGWAGGRGSPWHVPAAPGGRRVGGGALVIENAFEQEHAWLRQIHLCRWCMGRSTRTAARPCS